MVGTSSLGSWDGHWFNGWGFIWIYWWFMELANGKSVDSDVQSMVFGPAGNHFWLVVEPYPMWKMMEWVSQLGWWFHFQYGKVIIQPCSSQHHPVGALWSQLGTVMVEFLGIHGDKSWINPTPVWGRKYPSKTVIFWPSKMMLSWI